MSMVCQEASGSNGGSAWHQHYNILYKSVLEVGVMVYICSLSTWES